MNTQTHAHTHAYHALTHSHSAHPLYYVEFKYYVKMLTLMMLGRGAGVSDKNLTLLTLASGTERKLGLRAEIKRKLYK